MKSIKKLFIAVALVLLTGALVWGQALSVNGAKGHRGNRGQWGHRGQMRQIMEKYRDNAEFQTMLGEIREIRLDHRRQMEKLRSSGEEIDAETRNAHFAGLKEKLSDVRARYESKFPDFFAEAGKMLKMGRARFMEMKETPEFQQLQKVREKYQDNPDFIAMEKEIRTLRHEQAKKMPPMDGMKSGFNWQEIKARRQANQEKMQEIETKYQDRFPDYFEAKHALRDKIRREWANRNPGKARIAEIMEKYQDDATFLAMVKEGQTMRKAHFEEMKSLRESGDEEAIRAKRQEFRSALQEFKSKYQAQYPDFFEALEEIHGKFRRNRGGQKGNYNKVF